jgi:hypothetical protein
MPLPVAVEYLLAQEEYPGGPRLCFLGGTSYRFDAFPGSATETWNVVPAAGEYALVIFEVYFNTQMIPDAFRSLGTQFGARPFCALINGAYIDHYICTYMAITTATPWHVEAQNMTNVVQLYEMSHRHISFPSREAYVVGLEALRRMVTTTRMENAAESSAQMLSTMSGIPLGARPSIRGGTA